MNEIIFYKIIDNKNNNDDDDDDPHQLNKTVVLILGGRRIASFSFFIPKTCLKQEKSLKKLRII